MDRRNQVRNLCSDIVELSWENRFGWPQTTMGVLEDISSLGACVQTETPIPLNVDVTLRLREAAFEAEIQYCTLIAGGYFVGVEFAEERNWESEVSGPQHLLCIPADDSKQLR